MLSLILIVAQFVSLDCIIVNASAYTACKEECDASPDTTAGMTTPTPGRTLGISRDLWHLRGKLVYVQGVGLRRVEDKMAERFQQSIDVLFASKPEAMEYGRKDVKLWVLKRKETKRHD